MSALHLLWLSLKGLLIYASVLAAGVGSGWLLFRGGGFDDVFPGVVGGGLLMAFIVFVGLFMLVGRP